MVSLGSVFWPIARSVSTPRATAVAWRDDSLVSNCCSFLALSWRMLKK
jgi:hypothetical protein